MQAIFPWQLTTWQYLVNCKKNGRLPHAFLFKGIEGIGKEALGLNLAFWLLCANNSSMDISCGRCDACQLLIANNHPDLIQIDAKVSESVIKVEQIRAMIENLTQTSHQGGYKIAIIKRAELLNNSASNALLKTLEEPSEKIIILLITSKPMQLSATIRSRCQIITLSPPNFKVAKQWLKTQLGDIDDKLWLALADNAPLKVLAMAAGDRLTQRAKFFQDIYRLTLGKLSAVEMVANQLDLGLESFLEVLAYLIADLVKIKFGATNHLTNLDHKEKLGELAIKISLDRLFYLQDRIYRLRQCLASRLNLNQQLVMEHLLISWGQVLK